MDASHQTPGGGAGPPADRVTALYALFLLSGVAGLVYEVLWIRTFSLIFGSTTQAAAAVLGAFFAGLAVGGLVGARLARRRSTALWRYGVAELAIAAGALLVPVWTGLFASLYPHLYHAGGGTLTAAKLALAFVAMGVPCVAMGATLPLITRALVAQPGHLGRRAGVAYGLNTLGATAGVLLAGFVLPPVLGTTRSAYLAVALNVGVGAVALAISRRGRRAGREEAADDEAPATPEPAVANRSDRGVLAVVFASGFGTVALEVLYARLIVNVTDSSVFSFALMLATFLVFLSLAALAVSPGLDRLRNPWKLLAWTQSLAVVAILVSPALFNLTAADRSSELRPYLLRLLLQLTLVVGPTILLAGAALPVAWKIAARHAAESGARIGRLTSLNTFGAVLGSVVAGFLVVPNLGVSLGLGSIAVLYGVLAVFCWVRGYGGGRAVLAGVAIAAAFAGAVALRTVQGFQLLLTSGQRVVRFIEGESVNVAVIDDASFGRIVKVNNSYVLGASHPLAVTLQRNQTGLPLLLRPNARSVAFVGVGTAVSLSPVLDFPVERVLAIELLREVVEATADMETVNRAVLKDPRVETLVADGRNHLYATEERFDAIVGDLYVPWHAGTGYLYTVEHYRGIAERLAPGGLYAQWLPPHQMSVAELRMIVATFLEVYPAAELWLSRPDPGGLGGLALVGADGGGPTPETRAAAAASPRFPGLELLAGARVLREWSAGSPTNTDDFPRLEFSAAASRFESSRHVGEMRAALDALAALRQVEPGI